MTVNSALECVATSVPTMVRPPQTNVVRPQLAKVLAVALVSAAALYGSRILTNGTVSEEFVAHFSDDCETVSQATGAEPDTLRRPAKEVAERKWVSLV